MLFSSVSFLYLFLPLVLLIYFAVPPKIKNVVLLLSSLAFYFLGEPVYILLLVFSSLSDYFHSLMIEKMRGTGKEKLILISSIIINLAMLFFFKYTDFFIGIVNNIFGTSIPLMNIPLPIGISFFTFQTMSYTVDVYRKDIKAERNLLDMGTYVCLFPQLVAGPIVRYTDIAKELHNRKHTLSHFSYGILRFVTGLGKKVLIANVLGEFCRAALSLPEMSVLLCWLYTVFFALQIYFDFSGYSDMAIGIGAMFGFNFPENFNYPFISKSLSEFWRRWHMTLGRWFRDYVYFPLGGNRSGKLKLIRNLIIVWILTGLWHGAALNFVLWGMFFAIMLILEKLVYGKWLEKLPSVVKHIYTLLFIFISFAIFAGDSMEFLEKLFKGMFFIDTTISLSNESIYLIKSFLPIFAAAILGSTPLIKIIKNALSKNMVFSKIISAAEPIFIAAVLLLSTACLVQGSFNPFLYFRF